MSSYNVNKGVKSSHCDCSSEQAPFYDTLTKSTNVVFKPCGDEYNIKTPTLKMNLYHKPHCGTELRLDNDNGKVNGKIVQKMRSQDTDISLTFKSQGEAALKLTNSKAIPNSILNFETSTNKFTKLIFGYRRNIISAQSEFLRASNGTLSLTPSLCLRYKEVCLGVKANISHAQKLSDLIRDYNIAALYKKDKLLFSIFTNDKLNVVNAQMLYNICSNFQLGVEMQNDMRKAAEDTLLKVGTKVKFNDELTVGLKTSSRGVVESYTKHNYSDNSVVTIFSRFNVMNQLEKASMGVQFETTSDRKSVV